MQRAAMERTERVIIIADGSKVGTATPIVVGAPTEATTLVTDPSAPADELDRLRAEGLEVLIAERAAPARHKHAAVRHGRRRRTLGGRPWTRWAGSSAFRSP